jgi:scyllo-inositol 2-dehydrogenase (NADP+)
MNTPSGVVNVALIGYGMGGSLFHAPFIAHDPRLHLCAVVTADASRQARVRARYPTAALYRDVSTLLAERDDIGLVVVSTPNATHVTLAETILSHGLPVVVDKPVAPTSAETRRLAVLAEENDAWVVPFQNRRWDGDFRTVVELLRTGALGTLSTFESRFERWQPQISVMPERSWKYDPQPGAGTGILFDLGAHLVDQAVMLFGRPDEVFGQVATRRAPSGVDDDVFVALDYSGGPRVHLWMSAVAADRGPRFRLLGDRAAYVKWGMDTQEAHLSEGGSPGGPNWGEEPVESWGELMTGAERRRVPTLAGSYQLFYSAMASLLLDGAPPPVAVADAVVTAEIIEAAYRSSRTKSVARLNA